MTTMHELWVHGDSFNLGYQNIRDLGEGPCVRIRQSLEILWDIFKPYADQNYREEFARQTDARFWEMYLGARLLKAGKQLTKRGDMAGKGPDFLVREDGKCIWIEAVTFAQGDETNPDRVPDMKYDGQVYPVPVDQIELRMTSAMLGKFSKIRSYLDDGIIQPDDTVLIAVNPGKIGVQCNSQGRGSPMAVLYPLGDQYVSFFPGSDKADSGHHFRTEIEKQSGAKVPTGMFAREEYNEISGVIWSQVGLGNFTYDHNDLTFFPNGTPSTPLPQAWLDWETEWTVTSKNDREFQITRIT